MSALYKPSATVCRSYATAEADGNHFIIRVGWQEEYKNKFYVKNTHGIGLNREQAEILHKQLDDFLKAGEK